jgi:hypothetical protein
MLTCLNETELASGRARTAEVEQHRTIADARATNIVTAASHRALDLARDAHSHRSGYVAASAAAYHRGGASVDVCVPHTTGLLVRRVIDRQDQLQTLTTETLDHGVCHRRCRLLLQHSTCLFRPSSAPA